MAKTKVPEEDPVVQDVDDDEEDSDDDSSDDGPPDLEDGDASGSGKQSKMEKKSRSARIPSVGASSAGPSVVHSLL